MGSAECWVLWIWVCGSTLGAGCRGSECVLSCATASCPDWMWAIFPWASLQSVHLLPWNVYQRFGPVLIRWLLFFCLTFKSCLYILNSSAISDISLAKISPQPEASVFIFFGSILSKRRIFFNLNQMQLYPLFPLWGLHLLPRGSYGSYHRALVTLILSLASWSSVVSPLSLWSHWVDFCGGFRIGSWVLCSRMPTCPGILCWKQHLFGSCFLFCLISKSRFLREPRF